MKSTQNNTPVVYSQEALESLHYVQTKRRCFRRNIDSQEREEALLNYKRLIEEAGCIKEQDKEDAKWLLEELPGIDAPSIMAKRIEMKTRTDHAKASAKMCEARADVELMAASLGFRWAEVDTRTYADDIAREMITVRVDTMEQINKRRMSIAEAEAAEARLQGDLFAQH